jgi:uncharacterized protein (TIGR02996 family)
MRNGMNEEDALIRQIMLHPSDDTIRDVYADWLEEQGDPRAVFVRLQVELNGLFKERDRQQIAIDRAGIRRTRERIRLARSRLRNLRATIATDWLAQLDRTLIEHCSVRFQFRCPLQWADLQPTDASRVRFCNTCRTNVHYCTSVAEALDHARQRHCVAIDSTVPRVEGDLPERRVRMGVIRPPERIMLPVRNPPVLRVFREPPEEGERRRRMEPYRRQRRLELEDEEELR